MVDTGPVYLDSCTAFNSQCQDSLDPNCGKCQYRVLYDSSKCSRETPCDNLFIQFAFGGCQGMNIVSTDVGMGQVVERNTDFAAVCVQAILPGEVIPASLGAPERDNTLLTEVLDVMTNAARVGVWTGKNLLMGGCSQGATRYPVVAARYADDSNWMGSVKTGVCMSDGVVSMTYQDVFIGANLGTEQNCGARHRRIAEYYTTATPTPAHSCTGSPGGQCACDPNHQPRSYPGDCNDGDCIAFDSIIIQEGAGFAFAAGVTADSFAVKHWKLMSEGSDFAATNTRCEQDVVPEAPFKALCERIDAAPAHTCTHVSIPASPHCSYYGPHINDECVAWFRAL